MEAQITSYSEAKAAGSKRYFTGKPCKHGHIAPRQVNNRNCTICAAKKIEAIRLRKMATDPEFVAHRYKKSDEWHKANAERCTANRREWRRKNPDKVKAAHKRWRDKHRAHVRMKDAEYRAKNRQAARDAYKRWKLKNPERAKLVCKASNQTRRAKLAGNGGRFTAKDIENLYQQQDGKCACCQKPDDEMEIDHRKPVSKGGTSDPKNLQLLCLPCNRSKGDREYCLLHAV